MYSGIGQDVQLSINPFCCKETCMLSGIYESSPSSYVIHHDRWHEYCPGGSMHPPLEIGKQALTLTGMVQICQMSRQPGAVQCIVLGQGTRLNLYVGGKCSGPSSHPGNTRPALRACVSSSPSHNASSSSSWMSFPGLRSSALACVAAQRWCHGLRILSTTLNYSRPPVMQRTVSGQARAGSHCCIRAAVHCLLCGQQGSHFEQEVQQIP